jgi:hypothetical protein
MKQTRTQIEQNNDSLNNKYAKRQFDSKQNQQHKGRNQEKRCFIVFSTTF